MRISLLIPCYVDQLLPHVGQAVVEVLERLGHTVECPPGHTCCGQPAFNSGYTQEAKAVAAHCMRCFANADAVVVPSGSCAAMIRTFYRDVFCDEPDRESHATIEAIASRTFEFSEFLVDQLGVTDVGARFPHSVTFHDGCHGLRELNIRSQPRTLLEHVRDLTVMEMDAAQVCCGFGGMFSVKFPAVSTSMAETKAESIARTGAEFVVSNDPSCLLQLQGYLEASGNPVKCVHLAEVLATQ